MKLLLRALLLLLAALVFFALAGVWATWAPDRSVDELKPRWAQPPSQFVQVAGLSVHLRDEGPRSDPMPIVLLHGTSASLHTWDGWAATLRTERRVIRFDLPAFGLTGPNAEGDYTIATYVRFVTAMLDALGLQRVVLAGNSLGGEIAWATALAQPQRVERLVLIDSSGYDLASAGVQPSVPIGFLLARLSWLSPLTQRLMPRGLVERSLSAVYGDPSRVTPELVDRYAELALREGNRRALGQRMKVVLNVEPERIKGVRQPTLILWGGRDRLLVPELGRRFARDIAGSRLIMFDQLGHVPHEEDPTQTVTAVQEFLKL